MLHYQEMASLLWFIQLFAYLFFCDLRELPLCFECKIALTDSRTLGALEGEALQEPHL